MSKIGEETKQKASAENRSQDLEAAKGDDDEEEGEEGEDLSTPEWTIVQDQIEVLLIQANSSLQMLERAQTETLKSLASFYDEDDLQSLQQKQADFEVAFKRIIKQIGQKLAAIQPSADNQSEKVSESKVIKLMSESVVFKVQEMQQQFSLYKATEKRTEEEYDLKQHNSMKSTNDSTEETSDSYLNEESTQDNEEMSTLME